MTFRGMTSHLDCTFLITTLEAQILTKSHKSILIQAYLEKVVQIKVRGLVLWSLTTYAICQ